MPVVARERLAPTMILQRVVSSVSNSFAHARLWLLIALLAVLLGLLQRCSRLIRSPQQQGRPSQRLGWQNLRWVTGTLLRVADARRHSRRRSRPSRLCPSLFIEWGRGGLRLLNRRYQ